MNTTCIQRTRPSCIPIPKDTKSIKNSHLSTSTDFQTPSSPTPPNIQTTVKQTTLPTQKTSTAPTYLQQTRKIPLLPMPPAPVRQFNNRNHYRKFISRPSPPQVQHKFNLSRTINFNNNRFHQQLHIPGPHQQFLSKTIPTCTRTLHTVGIHLHTSHTTLPESTYHFTTILCHIRTKKKQLHVKNMTFLW